jgi:RNA polymerase sigma-70 factor (ECF subfamily)
MTSSTQAAAWSWDDALVPRVAAGEDAAWRAFHRHYYPIAAAFLRKLGVHEADMEDACQEVFLRTHRYLPSFRGEAQIKTWFYRLCATEATRVRRRNGVARSLFAALARHETDAVVPAATRSDDSVLALVSQALGEMKDWERLVFVLYEMEGLAGKEIAEIAACPTATVWRRLHDARRTFRRVLDL